MSIHERVPQFSKVFGSPGMGLPVTIQGALTGTDPSQPLESETAKAAKWPIVLIVIGLVLTLAWAGMFLWIALRVLADAIAWLLA